MEENRIECGTPDAVPVGASSAAPVRVRPAIRRAHRAGIETLCFLFLVVTLGFFTHFFRYAEPAGFFWDENYHIPSAQKYLNGVFFMEPHPPLGKLLIAAGELLLHPNERNDQFLDVDYAKEPPPGFSFAGYRLFPALLAWLTAPLVFLVFLELTRDRASSFWLSLLYVFDNAIIVHSRGAMLEGPQLFFIVLTVLLFLRQHRLQGIPRGRTRREIMVGLALGAAVAIKVNALVAAPLLLCLGWRLRLPARARAIALAGAGAVALVMAVWTIHIELGRTIRPKLKNSGFYEASEPYKEALRTNGAIGLTMLPQIIGDNLKFSQQYTKGVPELNLCKKDERGSYPLFWPLGASPINYKWEKTAPGTFRYLYLQANPAVWLFGLTALVVTSSFVLSRLFGGFRSGPRIALPMALLLFMYFGYMFTVLRVSRVLYLYHYFIPLLFTLFLIPFWIGRSRTILGVRMTRERRQNAYMSAAIVAALVFLAYSPLTYWKPVSAQWMRSRNIIPLWDLRCADCAPHNPMARPIDHPQPAQSKAPVQAANEALASALSASK